MTRLRDLHKRWMKDPEYRAEYYALRPTFELTMMLIETRVNAGLTQEQLAKRMGTTQSAVARLEGWSSNPSVNTLRKYADATGTRLRISFEPIEADAVSNGKEVPEHVEASDVEAEHPIVGGNLSLTT